MTLQRDRTITRLRPVGPGHQSAARLAVLETKLRPPVERDGMVRRTTLLERLTSSRSIRTVLVRAPAGYGKTSLLAQWAALDDRPVAWLSLDRHDDDPIRMAGLIVAAIDRIAPIDPDVIRALRVPVASVETEIHSTIGLAAAALDQPVLLIADDVQALRDRDAVDLLGGFADSLPPGSQLALAARGEPSLPIARLRARGELFELGPTDLAFDPAEALAMLRDAGAEPTSSETASLHRRTEGWPAGLYLAALAARAGAGGLDRTSEVSDRDRYLADYFRSELTPHLSPGQLRFLTRTSVLDRLDAPLCDAVAGRRGSAAMLAEIERADLFLVPLDRERVSYRYHPLFRAMLQDELERREPGRRVELLLRAADRCEAEGRFEEALGYVFAAGDLDRAADLFERVALPVFRSGRQAMVRDWLDRFDDVALERHPSAAALAGLAFAFVGEARDADRWVTRADRASRRSLDPAALGASGSSVASLVALARAVTVPDGVDRMAADAATSLELEPDWSPWRPFALLVSGLSHLLLGDLVRARTVLTEAAEVGESLGAESARSIALAELAVLAIDAGEWSAAGEYAARSRAIVVAAGLDDYPVSALAFAVTARVMVHRGDALRARQDLAHLATLCPAVTYALPWLAIQVRAEMARALLGLRAIDEARTLLEGMDAILERRPDVGTLRQKLDGLRERLARSTRGDRLETLTQAELRLIPLLPTHLSFIEIARIQVLSPNTVKTQAISIYRKLGASSRSDAVARARDLGLLDG